MTVVTLCLGCRAVIMMCLLCAWRLFKTKSLNTFPGLQCDVWAPVYGLCNYLDDDGHTLLLHTGTGLLSADGQCYGSSL